jgi:hypothetical protein
VLLLLLLGQIKLPVRAQQYQTSGALSTNHPRTHLGNADKDKAAGKKIQANRSGSGYRWRIFGLKRRTDNGFNVLSNAHTTPDEYPPASAAEGGEGASLVGHDTRQVQGGKIGRMWAKLNGNTGWVEPFNWDPARRYVTEI